MLGRFSPGEEKVMGLSLKVYKFILVTVSMLNAARLKRRHHISTSLINCLYCLHYWWILLHVWLISSVVESVMLVIKYVQTCFLGSTWDISTND